VIQVYTGDGKGKTTAALGLAMRAIGRGWRVMMIQFMKCGRYGEHIAAKRLAPQLTILCMGPGDDSDTECGDAHWVDPEHPSQEDIDAAEAALHNATHIIDAGEYDMVVLDEMLTALAYRLIAVEDVLKLIRLGRDGPELVLTGRRCPAEIIEVADLVTEMQSVKHYYGSGTEAREGIEF